MITMNQEKDINFVEDIVARELERNLGSSDRRKVDLAAKAISANQHLV